MYIYIHIYIYIYTYICIYMYTYIHIHTHTFGHIYIHIYIYKFIHILVPSSSQDISSKFVVLETKWFVSSNAKVILTRHTCGQRSSMSAWIKLQALEKYCDQRVCHTFQILKCRFHSDLGLRNFWVLAYREPLRNSKLRFFCSWNTFFFGSRHCTAVLCTQVPKSA